MEFLIQIHIFPFRWIKQFEQFEQFEFHSQTIYEISFKFCVCWNVFFLATEDLIRKAAEKSTRSFCNRVLDPWNQYLNTIRRGCSNGVNACAMVIWKMATNIVLKGYHLPLENINHLCSCFRHASVSSTYFCFLFVRPYSLIKLH